MLTSRNFSVINLAQRLEKSPSTLCRKKLRNAFECSQAKLEVVRKNVFMQINVHAETSEQLYGAIFCREKFKLSALVTCEILAVNKIARRKPKLLVN